MIRVVIFLCAISLLGVSEGASLNKFATLYPFNCGPVCMIYCPNGNILNEDGCPTCNCKEVTKSNLGTQHLILRNPGQDFTAV